MKYDELSDKATTVVITRAEQTNIVLTVVFCSPTSKSSKLQLVKGENYSYFSWNHEYLANFRFASKSKCCFNRRMARGVVSRPIFIRCVVGFHEQLDVLCRPGHGVWPFSSSNGLLFTNGKQFQVANIKTYRSPPSNVASEKSTPIAKGIRLIGFVGRQELNSKKEFRHHLRKEMGVPVVFLCHNQDSDIRKKCTMVMEIPELFICMHYTRPLRIACCSRSSVGGDGKRRLTSVIETRPDRRS